MSHNCIHSTPKGNCATSDSLLPCAVGIRNPENLKPLSKTKQKILRNCRCLRGIRQRTIIAKIEDSANESGVPVTCEKSAEQASLKDLLGLVLSALPRRSNSHSCALHSCNMTNLHQHASAGKWALKKMEHRGY